MRGGIRVTANLDYEVEHNISTELCTTDLRQSKTCLVVSDGWPYNSLSIDAFYQFRSVKWCGGWIKYVSHL